MVKPAWASEIGEDAYGQYADFSVKSVVQRCRWIEPGTFTMGSPATELERYDDEMQHSVTLSGYWLADTACTQALWEAVMGNNPSLFKDNPQNPVDSVSWNDAANFYFWLNKLVPGLDAGFPSEAQWEYACRAGTTTPFSFGENLTTELANYDGRYPYANQSKGECPRSTVPVCTFSANAWGLYEMHGNVWEWCFDWYGNYTTEMQRDPVGAQEGYIRVLRGGSWLASGRFLRTACRAGNFPGERYDISGLRVATGRKK